jgi:hypothetical protein
MDIIGDPTDFQSNVVNTSNNQVSHQEIKLEEKNEIQLPPRTDINGKKIKLKNYKDLRTLHKINKQRDLFISHLKVILKEYSPNENQLDDEMLIEVLNIAEEYFYIGNKEQRNEAKQSAVKEIMLPYFMNNDFVLDKCIGNIYHKVRKSNWVKRSLKRVSHFFKKKNSV